MSTFESTGAGNTPAWPRVPEGHTIEEVDAPDDYTKDLQAFYDKISKK
ncbi:MAG TPA: hypothetical protein VJ599_04360 [Nitrososphaeraceae archaeon]|nr:hypothetical protein [Nitrososphaeraceae archaeon]